MTNNDIKNMNNSELEKYIEVTKKTIQGLLEEYINISYDKLAQNEKIEFLKKRAYDIKKIFEYAEWVNNKININDNISERITTIPKRGEIWTCELGKNIGSEENKVRPVIIIQNDTGNEKGPTTIIVPISNRHKKIATHLEIRESDYKLEIGERNKITGTVLCEQLKVVSKARLGRHIATLNTDFMKRFLNPKLKISLDM